MELIKNNKGFEGIIPGLTFTEVLRETEGGSLKGFSMHDDKGNFISCRVQWDSFDFFTKAPPTVHFNLIGTINGIKINEIFDSKGKAEVKLKKFEKAFELEIHLLALEIKEILI